MNDIALFTVRQYISANLFRPSAGWSLYYFKERAYARWATFEILDIIRKRPDDPLICIEAFACKLKKYAVSATENDAAFIFSTAYNTAVDILNTLEQALSSKGE